MAHFSLLDWAIAIFTLVVTLGLGLYAKRYVGRLEDYLVASRGMGLYVGTASLVSTEIGIITYMYQAQFGFLAGFSAFVVGLITIAVCYAVGRTGFVITHLREMEIMTVPEYFERRYTRGVRVLAGAIMAFGGCLNLGIFPLIEARFLTILTGIDPRYVTWTMAALLLIALAYTAIGGMVSLLLTNYLQYLLLAAGTVVVTVACLSRTGWPALGAAVRQHLDGRGFDPIADFGVAFILWQILLWTALMTVWQTVAMRTFSTRDAATAGKVFTLTSGLFLGRAVLPMAWGIAALAYFGGTGPPPPEDVTRDGDPTVRMERLEVELARDFPASMAEGRLGAVLPRVSELLRLADAEKKAGAGDPAREAAADRYARSAQARREELGLVAMPWMLASILPTGLLGVVLAGMLAASVSTYAGYFLGWSAIIAQDVVRPSLRSELTASAQLRLTRFTVIGLTVFIMVWSLVYEVPGPAFFYLQVTANLFMAPTLITIVAGIYWKRASSAGAYLSFVLGAVASLGYLLPRLGLSVATAGNLSWGLAAVGLVAGSLALPDRRQPAEGGR
jgi:Na+/proline symporter